MKKDILITTRGPEPGIYFSLPNGKKCYIGECDADFFMQLQNLPAETKIKMMLLTEEQMIDYINKSRKEANSLLIEILSKKWYWRETGDEAIIQKGMIEGVDLSAEDILKKCKSKRRLPLKDIKLVIEYFTNDRAEVYTKCED